MPYKDEYSASSGEFSLENEVSNTIIIIYVIIYLRVILFHRYTFHPVTKVTYHIYTYVTYFWRLFIVKHCVFWKLHRSFKFKQIKKIDISIFFMYFTYTNSQRGVRPVGYC